mgnify:CR=1 FL=1
MDAAICKVDYKYNSQYYKSHATLDMIKTVEKFKSIMADEDIKQKDIARVTKINFRKINKFFVLNMTKGAWSELKRPIERAIYNLSTRGKIAAVLDSLGSISHINDEYPASTFGESINIYSDNIPKTRLVMQNVTGGVYSEVYGDISAMFLSPQCDYLDSLYVGVSVDIGTNTNADTTYIINQ